MAAAVRSAAQRGVLDGKTGGQRRRRRHASTGPGGGVGGGGRPPSSSAAMLPHRSASTGSSPSRERRRMLRSATSAGPGGGRRRCSLFHRRNRGKRDRAGPDLPSARRRGNGSASGACGGRRRPWRRDRQIWPPAVGRAGSGDLHARGTWRSPAPAAGNAAKLEMPASLKRPGQSAQGGGCARWDSNRNTHPCPLQVDGEVARRGPRPPVARSPAPSPKPLRSGPSARKGSNASRPPLAAAATTRPPPRSARGLDGP